MSRPGESAHPVEAKGVFDHAEKNENRKSPPKNLRGEQCMIELRRTLIAGVIFLTVFILMLGCASQQANSNNTELVVSYDNGAVWKTEQHLRAASLIPEPKYLVFGVEWCESCLHLQRLLKSAEVLDSTSVLFLNARERWVRNLMVQIGGINEVPYMIQVGEDGIFGARRVGTNKILIYLLAHVEKSE